MNKKEETEITVEVCPGYFVPESDTIPVLAKELEDLRIHKKHFITLEKNYDACFERAKDLEMKLHNTELKLRQTEDECKRKTKQLEESLEKTFPDSRT